MQVKDHLLNCVVVSFAIDESADINYIAGNSCPIWIH